MAGRITRLVHNLSIKGKGHVWLVLRLRQEVVEIHDLLLLPPGRAAVLSLN